MSNEGEQKPVDVDALIEAKRQRMAGGSPAAKAAEEKAVQAAAESARRAAEEQVAKPTVREEIYDRLAREAVYKKQSASLLAQVTLVPADDVETSDELMPIHRPVGGPSGSSKRRRKRGSTARHKRRSGSTARHKRRSGSRPQLNRSGGGGDDGSIGILMAILGILLVLGLVFLIL